MEEGNNHIFVDFPRSCLQSQTTFRPFGWSGWIFRRGDCFATRRMGPKYSNWTAKFNSKSAKSNSGKQEIGN